MNSQELRASLGLALVFVLRMLGLFMVLPVFALYARGLMGVTPPRLGLALGIYGLTQASLQAPFGLLSDRIGRKPVIALGAVIFAIGSYIAGTAQDIDWVIFGRALQGAGAIGAVVNALVADFTRESQRTKAMALVGVSIGASFLLALILGPVLSAHIGVPGIFYTSAALGLLSLAVLYGYVPQAPDLPHAEKPNVMSSLKAVLGNVALLRLDAGIFIQHALLTALFVAVPIALRDSAGLDSQEHWKVYLPVMLISLLGTIPLYQLGERKGHARLAMSVSVALLGVAQFGLLWRHDSLPFISFMLVLFFAGFNLLEASLPSLVSKTAPAAHRGTALGVYSSLQFLGIFTGGVLGGWLLGHGGPSYVFTLGGIAAVVWITFAHKLKAV